eukprot:4037573-Prymnesium_polylepis.1
MSTIVRSWKGVRRDHSGGGGEGGGGEGGGGKGGGGNGGGGDGGGEGQGDGGGDGGGGPCARTAGPGRTLCRRRKA